MDIKGIAWGEVEDFSNICDYVTGCLGERGFCCLIGAGPEWAGVGEVHAGMGRGVFFPPAAAVCGDREGFCVLLCGDTDEYESMSRWCILMAHRIK